MQSALTMALRQRTEKGKKSRRRRKKSSFTGEAARRYGRKSGRTDAHAGANLTGSIGTTFKLALGIWGWFDTYIGGTGASGYLLHKPCAEVRKEAATQGTIRPHLCGPIAEDIDDTRHIEY